jgi:hypothetical protein
MHELDTKSKNEQGKPLYPKLVYPNGPSGEAVKVLNHDNEEEVMGVKKEEALVQPIVDNVVKPNW